MIIRRAGRRVRRGEDSHLSRETGGRPARGGNTEPARDRLQELILGLWMIGEGQGRRRRDTQGRTTTMTREIRTPHRGAPLRLCTLADYSKWMSARLSRLREIPMSESRIVLVRRSLPDAQLHLHHQHATTMPTATIPKNDLIPTMTTAHSLHASLLEQMTYRLLELLLPGHLATELRLLPWLHPLAQLQRSPCPLTSVPHQPHRLVVRAAWLRGAVSLVRREVAAASEVTLVGAATLAAEAISEAEVALAVEETTEDVVDSEAASAAEETTADVEISEAGVALLGEVMGRHPVLVAPVVVRATTVSR